jgi:hypothetical protein
VGQDGRLGLVYANHLDLAARQRVRAIAAQPALVTTMMPEPRSDTETMRRKGGAASLHKNACV